MSIRFQCPNLACGSIIRAPETAAGRQAKCPACGQIVTVPQASDTDLFDALPEPQTPLHTGVGVRTIPPIQTRRRSNMPWYIWLVGVAAAAGVGVLIYVGMSGEDTPPPSESLATKTPAQHPRSQAEPVEPVPEAPAEPVAQEPVEEPPAVVAEGTAEPDPRDLGPELQFKEKKATYGSVLLRSKENTRATRSMDQLRSVGQAIKMYQAMNDGWPNSLDDLASQGLLDKGLLTSPADDEETFVYLKPAGRVRSQTVVAYDPVPYLGNQFNALFSDGSVLQMSQADLQELLRK